MMMRRLGFDLGAGGLVHGFFFLKELFEDAAEFLANVIVRFEEVDVFAGGELLGGEGGELVDLVAAQSHSTALYFFTSSFLIFLNISW